MSPSNPPLRSACPVRMPPTEEPTITTRSRIVVNQPERGDRATADRRRRGFLLIVGDILAQHHNESVVVEVEMLRVFRNAVAVALADSGVRGDAHISVLPWLCAKARSSSRVAWFG